MKERPSKIFLLSLWVLRPFRRPYLWLKRKYPDFFARRLSAEVDVDTSRMLDRFNAFHRLFFSRGFDMIKFDPTELQHLENARQKGPVVLLMRHWGQVEYNFFNDLFLKENLPLASHNNMVRMGHWMPGKLRRPIFRKKLDAFFETGRWPYNNELFDLVAALAADRTILYCLNLSRGIHWMDETPDSQTAIFKELQKAQADLSRPIQLVPLHFIYDKHPGRAKKSLLDVLLGEKENPGYLRKMLLFLRNYQKRAVARISEPLDFNILVSQCSSVAPEAVSYECAHFMQRIFDLETRQVTGPKLKSRRRFIAKILDTPKVRQKIRQVADGQKLSFEAAEKKTSGYLKEIASDIRFTLIELWDVFLSWLFHTIYDGVEVDEAGLQKVKKVARDSPLILAPCHKSHMDYILLSYVFYQYDLSLPHVCAGINLSFWPLGPLFRRSGAYFIRRSMPPDPFYPLALKTYVQALIHEGYFQEFFIEGTRSRSGKLFPPKTGLLQMMIESYLENGERDLYFVPLSISYERIIEEESYLRELKGDKKKREGFFDLLKLPKFLRRRYGKIYLEFSEPISLKERLGERSAALAKDPAALKAFTQEFAEQICLSINDVTMLLPSPLVAAALLGHREKSISREQVHEKAQELFNVAEASRFRLTEGLKRNLHFSVEEILGTFSKEGLLRMHSDESGDFFTLPAENRLHLDFFKNKGMHAFAAASLWQGCRRNEALFLKRRELFDKEYFFPAGTPAAGSAVPDWLGELTAPVVECYRLCLQSIERMDIEKMEDKTLVKAILEAGETAYLKGSLHYPESLSRFTVQNALAKFTECGLLRNHVAEMGLPGRRYLSKTHDAQKNLEIQACLQD